MSLCRAMSKHPLSTFGENVRLRLEALGMNQAQLAERAGIGRNTLIPIMYRTPASPSFYAMEWVAEAVGQPLWTLLKPQENQ